MVTIIDIINSSNEVTALISVLAGAAHGDVSLEDARKWLAENYPGYENDYLHKACTETDVQGELPLDS